MADEKTEIVNVPVEYHSQTDTVLHLQINKFVGLPATAIEEFRQSAGGCIVNQKAG